MEKNVLIPRNTDVAKCVDERRLGVLAYGGDWNPEQWPEEIWSQDVRLMREAGVNRVSLGIFAWSKLEPAEGVYDFAWFDRCMDLLAENGIRANLATPTAAPPPWFAATYPQALPVDADGRVLSHGSRQAFCPSSPIYREKALNIAEKVARRYAGHEALALWHIHNEYGCHNSRCFCDTSAEAFRSWLCERYQSVDQVNQAWGSAFWSQLYSDWSQILPPRATPTFTNPAQQLDFRRFSSDALIELYRAERDLLASITPGVPFSTNLMPGMHWEMDQFAFARELDVVSADHYLVVTDPEPHIHLAFSADLARSLNGGRPWLLMEHSTSGVNWQGHNRSKQPGEMIRNSVQHLARGADGIMFFQWRASASGAEKWHSAMVPHAGTETKIWREVVELGGLLHDNAAVEGSTVAADVAILMDYASIWAQEHPAQPTTKHKPIDVIREWYGQLWKLGVTADVVHPSADLTGYKAVIVPALYSVNDHSQANLERFVEQGGVTLVGPYSGIVDEHDRVRLGGYPGAWRDLLGITVEEFFPLDGDILLASGATGTVWSQLTHPRGAKVLDSYATGEPAWTRNVYGEGVAHSLTTLLTGDDLKHVIAEVCADAGVATSDHPGVEIVRRGHSDGGVHVFAINHTAEDATVQGVGTVPAGRVVIAHQASAFLQEVAP